MCMAYHMQGDLYYVLCGTLVDALDVTICSSLAGHELQG